MATYYVYIKPEPGKKLRTLLENSQEDHLRVKRVMQELDGIGEIDRGTNRQMILTKPEFRLVANLVKENDLKVELVSL